MGNFNTVSLQRCDNCDQPVGNEALFCPYCLTDYVKIEEAWMAYTTSSADNSVLAHELVPEHRLYPKTKLENLLDQYGIERTDLPKIRHSDPALQHLPCSQGDVVEIVRDSRTTDKAKSYRLVVGGDGSLDGSLSAEESWRNPEGPVEGTYARSEDLTEEQALHVLENLRAHIPPSSPGTCDSIAVGREEEISRAVERVDRGEPYTFVRGELGYGKSFFLQWVRDRVFPTTAVSFVDLTESLTFQTTADLVEEITTNLETPRSVAHDEYANGLDELWDTCLRQLADLCAGHLEGQGYQLRQDLVGESLQSSVQGIFSEQHVPDDVVEAFVSLSGSYFDSRPQSISQYLESETDIAGLDLLKLVAVLAQCSGYRILIGVDELEKSDRSREHFKAIEEFVAALPSGVSLFVTGTPELVRGGEEGNALKETYTPLYERTTEHLIGLKPPTEEDIRAFTERLLEIEDRAHQEAKNKEYSRGVESIGGENAAVDSFLSEQSPSFRAYLDHIESEA